MNDMRATRHSLLAGGVAMAIGVVLSACSSGTKTTPAEAAAPVPVTVATVAMTDIADTFEAGGVVQARNTATIMARILAPVREVRVAPGDRVRAGQVLVVLDGRDLGAHARSAHAAALAADQGASAAAFEQQAADAALALARTTHDTHRRPAREAVRRRRRNSMTPPAPCARPKPGRPARPPGRRPPCPAWKAHARPARRQTRRSRSRSSRHPSTEWSPKRWSSPATWRRLVTPLVRLEDTRGFRLDVRVDESRIGQISPGAVVPVSLDSGTGGAPTTVNGTVAEIGRAVDADARAFLVKITLPDTPGLRSGGFGRARFSAQARRALTVPAGALVHRGQMTSVFVVENGIARVRLVNVSGTEVLAGLSEGDVVIVAAACHGD